MASAIVALMLVSTLADDGVLSKPQQKLQAHIKGKLKDDLYTSISGDFRVRVPELLYPNAKVRDEDEPEGSQVIFTDDFGAFYRVVSLRKSSIGVTLDESLSVFSDVRDRVQIDTSRGHEWRIVSVEREGAEMSIQILQADGQLKKQIPDLVLANAAFASGERIYHIAAGVPVLKGALPPIGLDENGAMALARKRLDSFLEGFELVSTRR